ncbi:MAG TPA: GTPase [candidate division Zixibacteria bacterium]
MPANLPPQYYEAERRYREAKDPQDKLRILHEMYAIMPKHKGTDKLQADVKSKISKLNKEILQKKKTSRRGDQYFVEKEGAAQVVLIGPPNVGKSQVLTSLTHATPEVAAYPYTTTKPLSGMMFFENIQIQLVDTPPIAAEFMEPWLAGIIRSADLVCLMADLGSETMLEEIGEVLQKLQEYKIILERNEGETNPLDGIAHKKTFILGNKIDSALSEMNLKMLKDKYEQSLPIFILSAKEKTNLEEFKLFIYNSLEILRVYTKTPGKKADYEDPVILKKGSTLLEAARAIHKDFAYNLKYARIWGEGVYDGQMVQKDFVLKDGHVVEFHI